MSSTQLAIYTVYERPRDYPGEFVVRRFLVPPGLPERDLFARGRTLAAVRAALPPGLVCLDPAPGDDPVIREVWL